MFENRWIVIITIVGVAIFVLIAGLFGGCYWGKALGYDLGYEEGIKAGHSEGYEEGNKIGYDKGYEVGNQEGEKTGYDKGYIEGNEAGLQEGFSTGYKDGYDNGYREAKKEGIKATASWNGAILAEAEEYLTIDKIVYFPHDSVNWSYLMESRSTCKCTWKGEGKYYNIVVDDKVNNDGAWSYPEPTKAAMLIKGYVAFAETVDVVIKK